MVEVRQYIRLQLQRYGKDSECVLQCLHSSAIHAFQHIRIFHPIKGYSRMYIADKRVGLILFTILTTHSSNLTSLFYQFFNLLLASYGSSHCSDVISQFVHHQVAFSFQSPTALNIASCGMSKAVQRQRLSSQFCFQCRT